MNRVIVLVGLLCFGEVCLAASNIRAEGTVDIRGSKPSDEDKKRAQEVAKENAWKFFQMSFASGARAANFLTHAGAIKAQMDAFCVYEFYDPNVNKSARTFSIRVNMECNEKTIDALLVNLAGGRKAARKERIVFVFLSRRAADSTEFLEKRSVTNSATVETSGSEMMGDVSSETDSYTLSGSSDGASVTQSQTTESKGKVDNRDTVFNYVVEPSDVVDNAVTSGLGDGGYRVIPYGNLAAMGCPPPSIDEIASGLGSSSKQSRELLPNDIRTQMIQAVRQCQIPLFAVGLMDVLKSRKSPDGTWLVTVQLTARIDHALEGYSIAAIDGIQFEGFGKDRLEAANVALSKAAEAGARTLVDKLQLELGDN